MRNWEWNFTKRNNWNPNWVSSPLSFFLSASTTAAYIFTAPTRTTTIISLEPRALNVEFQHFMLRFNKISLLCGYHWKSGEVVKAERIGGEREGGIRDNFNLLWHFVTHLLHVHVMQYNLNFGMYWSSFQIRRLLSQTFNSQDKTQCKCWKHHGYGMCHVCIRVGWLLEYIIDQYCPSWF
jgi:hypothetical protein